jgi:hypothetical protein
MEHEMRRVLAFVVTLVLSMSATAATGWTGYRTIVRLETVSTGIEVTLDGFSGACAPWSEAGVQYTWVKIETNQANEKQHIATLLMAFAAGKRVSVYCPSDGANPTLSNMRVQNE